MMRLTMMYSSVILCTSFSCGLVRIDFQLAALEIKIPILGPVLTYHSTLVWYI